MGSDGPRWRPDREPGALTDLLTALDIPSFRCRAPWWGPDLQTLRDTLWPEPLPPDRSRPLELAIGEGDHLFARLDLGAEPHRAARGLVLLVPGLGGDSEGLGCRRLALALLQAGFAVLRLNLRGAGAGRRLARGSYAARCDRDLLPVISACRELCRDLGHGGDPVPLLGVGLSLGGTVLLNLCHGRPQDQPAFAALVAVSSPLDLAEAAACIGRPRNAVYQRWMVRRLLRQVRADPQGLSAEEQERLARLGGRTPDLRQFDAAVTAPRWGWPSVERYYSEASPLPWLLQGGSGVPTLLLHACDDPWVPASAHRRLRQDLPASAAVTVLLSQAGGHNGFHAPQGCWSDRVVVRWLCQRFAAGDSG